MFSFFDDEGNHKDFLSNITAQDNEFGQDLIDKFKDKSADRYEFVLPTSGTIDILVNQFYLEG